jgi:AcrR family transcriptional regulator
LIEEAGISRASFYVHFECQHTAVAALAENVMEQIHDIWYPWLAGEQPGSRTSLEAVCGLRRARRRNPGRCARMAQRERALPSIQRQRAGTGRRKPLNRVANAELRQAILAATEGLLRERRLEDLTVVDMIEAAGCSRPSFYMYFESKHAAVAAAEGWRTDPTVYDLNLAFSDPGSTVGDDRRLAETLSAVWLRAIHGSSG